MPVYPLLSSSLGNAPLTSAAGQPSKTNRKHNGICSCECEAIVESVLAPLPHHYLAMGDASRAFYYLLECVAAYLHVSNNYMVSYPAYQHPPEASQSPGSGQEKLAVVRGHAFVGPWKGKAAVRP